MIHHHEITFSAIHDLLGHKKINRKLTNNATKLNGVGQTDFVFKEFRSIPTYVFGREPQY